MEPTGIQVPKPEEALGSKRRDKPLLAAEQQIAHLKAKGVTFDLCSEDEAAAHLSGKCQFFKVIAYRKLFDKRDDGEQAGCYIGLDFAHLKLLAGIDRRLRDTLLHMTLDVEHFAAASLLADAEAHGEDGYAIMSDYLASVSPSRRRYIENELDIRSNDVYCGAVVGKYRDDMPIWAFCEVVSFGTFIGLMKFCAERWDDRRILADHYLIKKAKSVRNASVAFELLRLWTVRMLAEGAIDPVTYEAAKKRLGVQGFTAQEFGLGAAPKSLSAQPWLFLARIDRWLLRSLIAYSEDELIFFFRRVE